MPATRFRRIRDYAPAPPAPSTPDPLLLAVASGQTPLFSAYDTLNIPAMAAGGMYQDPLTGRSVWKVTSPTVPSTNTGCTHGYAEYGPFVSRGWGANKKHTIAFADSSSAWYLVDFQRGVGLSNYRAFPGAISPNGDTGICFSNVVSTPQICYTFTNTGGTLHKVDTAPATPTEITSGFFPKVGFGTAFVAPQVMQDQNDEWFVGGNSLSGGTMHAWNSITNTYVDAPGVTDGNDIRIIRGDVARAIINHSPSADYSVWDLPSNTLLARYTFYTFASHPGALRKYIVSSDGSIAAPYAFQYTDITVNPVVKALVPTSPGGFDHHNGCWIQAGAVLNQWFVGGADSAYTAGTVFNHAIGYIRLTDGERRVLCHHYSDDVTVVNGQTYYGRPFASASPDGRVVIFASKQIRLGAATRYDLFVVEVPLS